MLKYPVTIGHDWSESLKRREKVTNGRVLVVSNALFMRLMLRHTLETLNLHVTVASNTKQAAERLLETAPDIVFVDIVDESDADIELFHLARNRNTSCVIIGLIPAEHEKPEIIVELVQAGMNGYVRGPISVERVKAQVETSMQKSVHQDNAR